MAKHQLGCCLKRLSYLAYLGACDVGRAYLVDLAVLHSVTFALRPLAAFGPVLDHAALSPVAKGSAVPVPAALNLAAPDVPLRTAVDRVVALVKL